MNSRCLIFVFVLAACKDQNRSAPPPPRPEVVGITSDLVAIQGGEFIGRGSYCKAGPRAPGDWEYKERLLSVKQSIASFSIDRRVTSCADYNKCRSAGVCSERADCLDGQADVSLAGATDYCAWRGMHVVRVAEWQRAIRSMDGRLHPGGKTEITWGEIAGAWPCLNVRERDQPCDLVSPDGVEYSIFSEPELTSDTDCKYRDGIVEIAPVLVSRSTPLLAGVDVREGYGVFRCAR